MNSIPSNPRTGTHRSSELTTYLAGAIGTAALMGAPQAEAAVTAVTFGFGPVFNAADGAGRFQTTPAFGALDGYSGRGFSVLGSYGSSVYNQNQTPYYGLSIGTPSFFAGHRHR